jgi:hypothetical protein
LVITLSWINGLPPHLENGTDRHLLASKDHLEQRTGNDDPRSRLNVNRSRAKDE